MTIDFLEEKKASVNVYIVEYIEYTADKVRNHPVSTKTLFPRQYRNNVYKDIFRCLVTFRICYRAEQLLLNVITLCDITFVRDTSNVAET